MSGFESRVTALLARPSVLGALAFETEAETRVRELVRDAADVAALAYLDGLEAGAKEARVDGEIDRVAAVGWWRSWTAARLAAAVNEEGDDDDVRVF